MDTQKIAYRISNYCLNQYPDLEWNVNSDENKTVICGVEFPFKVTLKICSDKRDEFFLYDEETAYDYIIGNFDLLGGVWVGTFGIGLNCDKRIDFQSFPIAKWNKKEWDLHKKYREVMLDIFIFILDEIQE